MRHLPVLALLCSIGCNAQHAARVHQDDESDGGERERSDAAATVTEPDEPVDEGEPDDAGTAKDASSSANTRDASAAESDAGALDGGSTVSDAASCDSTALKVTLTLRQQPPDVSIVLDRSGSMQPMSGIDCSKNDITTSITCTALGIDCNDPAYKGTVTCGGSAAAADRWTPAVSALKSYTAMFEAKVSFGLTLFPGSSTGNSSREACAPGEERVALGLQRAGAIAAVLDMTKPLGNTPTASTLDVVRTQIQTRKAQANGELAAQYVLLVTDGQATCPTATGAGGTATNTEAHAATLRAIDALSALGVKTYVLGLDGMNVQLAKQLTEYAVHGGSGDFYAVEAGISFAPRLAEITAGTVDCDFALDQLPASGHALRVELDGKEVLPDASNGYTRQGLSVHLHGAACARVRSAGVQPSARSVCMP